MTAKAVDLAMEAAAKEAASAAYTLTFMKPIELKQNIIYCIHNFLECESGFGKTWNVIIEGDRAVRMPSFYREQHEDLKKFKRGKYFLVFGGTRESKNGFCYGVLKFPELTMMDTLCFCSEKCDNCLCHRLTSPMDMVEYTCSCTSRRAKNMVNMHNQLSRILFDQDHDKENIPPLPVPAPEADTFKVPAIPPAR